MKTALTYIFVIISSLGLGGLVGNNIGNSNKTKLTTQRDMSLKLAEEYKGLLDKSEKDALKCLDTLTVMRTLATGCCNEAEKALNELDICRQTDSGKK